MSISFINNDPYASSLNRYVEVDNEGTEGSPVSFSDITDYFEANPIPLDLVLPSTGELCENNSAAWSILSGDADAPVDESTIVQEGSYSINTTKNGDGDFTMQWLCNDDPVINYYYFNGQIAEKIKVWVRTDANIHLTSIRLWFAYNTTTRLKHTYLWFYNDYAGWDFVADTWTEIELDIRNDCLQTYSGRNNTQWVSAVDFTFSGGASGDKVYIDGLKLVLDNPNPRKLGTDNYLFPLPIYLKGTTYFADESFATTFRLLSGGKDPMFSTDATAEYHLGSALYGGQILMDNLSKSNDAGAFYGNGYMTNLNARGRVGNGMGNVSVLENTNCTYNQIQDFKGGICKDVYIGDCRYALWPAGSQPSSFDGFSVNDGYAWSYRIATMTVRGMKPIGYGTSDIFMFTSLYNRAINSDTYMIDTDLSSSDGGVMKFGFAIVQASQEGYTITQHFQFSLNIKILDIDNNFVEDAIITLYDKNGDELFNVNTDVNGDMPEQVVTSTKNSVTADGVSTAYVVWNPRDITTDTYQGPFTMIITKDGFGMYKSKFDLIEKNELTITMPTAGTETKINNSIINNSNIY